MRARPGFRLQIVLALAGLMLLAFVPLFFAVASLAQATVHGAREQSARVLGRAIAAHAGEAYGQAGSGGVVRALQAHVGREGLQALCVFQGRLAGGMRRPVGGGGRPPRAVERERRDGHGDPRGGGKGDGVASPTGGASPWSCAFTSRTAAAAASPWSDWSRSVQITFALALLVFAYMALTRLIVGPIEQLVDAADRVAAALAPCASRREARASWRARGQRADDGRAAHRRGGGAGFFKVEELTEMTRRNAEAQAQVIRSERMASVGRLAAGVAHEIGNPIAALVGMEELLLDGDLSPAEHRDFLLRMRRETERIHTVIRDLLDFARPEGAAGSSSPPAPADVRHVIADVVALVRPQKDFRGVKVEVDVDGTPPVGLPAPRLTQVLLNLVLNAGASVATARPEGGRVTVRARAEGRRVRIEVEDDGPGVDPAVRNRLFEPFVTTKEVGDGTGLGLAVCRGLVESVGGEVAVDASYTAERGSLSCSYRYGLTRGPWASFRGRPGQSSHGASGTMSRPSAAMASRRTAERLDGGRLPVARLGRVVQEDDRAVAQVASNACDDVFDARARRAVPPGGAPSDDGQVEARRPRARWSRRCARRAAERASAAPGHPLERIEARAADRGARAARGAARRGGRGPTSAARRRAPPRR